MNTDPQTHTPTRLSLIHTLCVLLAAWATLFVATPTQAQPSERKTHFLSSSLFMLYNLRGADDHPAFYQLNYGMRLTPKDTLIVEAITWQYHAPLGIPVHRLHEDHPTFPGKVKDFGVGLAYHRFLWKGAYATLHAIPFLQQYYDENDNLIQTGFQLFLTARLGYHFNVWKDTVFIEPSVAATAWPINTNLPADFAREENKWPSYFLFEPGLHIGVNF